MSSRRVFLLAQTEQPLLWRLNPRQRTQALAGLALVVLLGAILILFAWWGARVTRRQLRQGRATNARGGHVDDWAEKPLCEKDEEA